MLEKLSKVEKEAYKFGIDFQVLEKLNEDKLFVKINNFTSILHFVQKTNDLEAILIIPNIVADYSKTKLLEKSNDFATEYLFSCFVDKFLDDQGLKYGINIKGTINFDLSMENIFYKLNQAFFLCIEIQKAFLSYEVEKSIDLSIFKVLENNIEELASNMFVVE